MMASGTEVAGTLLAKSKDSAALILTMETNVEGTTLVSSIMVKEPAFGQIIARMGQSALNMT